MGDCTECHPNDHNLIVCLDLMGSFIGASLVQKNRDLWEGRSFEEPAH